MTDPDAALGDLAATAALPAERARSLPPALYVDPDVAERERAAIFRRDWVCVGRADEIEATGDYLTTTIDTTPVLVVRQKDGAIAAFANVCRHRLSGVAEGRGTARGFVCPYHGWSYDLAGRLLMAPRMPAGTVPEGTHLPALPVALWNGFVYVALDPAADPDGFLASLEPLTALARRYRIGDMRTVRTGRERWRTNWKVLVENFLEAYHLPRTHPDTLTPIAPPENVDMLTGHDAFHVYAHRMADTLPIATLDPAIAIDNPELDDATRRLALIGGIFPSHLFSITWDWVFWLSLQPAGVDAVIVEHGVAAPLRLDRSRPVPADHPNLYCLDLVDRVNEEDRLRVEAVQRGAASGFGAQARLHPHEATLHSFACYLAKRLVEPSA